jgi:hypothetical protein
VLLKGSQNAPLEFVPPFPCFHELASIKMMARGLLTESFVVQSMATSAGEAFV